nr:MAG TPA: tail protein [Caudoviricetes sp.]
MDRQLIDYLPAVLQQYAEFKEICKVEQPQIAQLWDDIDRLLLEAFIQDESEIGAARWEKILDIQPFDTDSLEVRNFRIHGRMLQEAPYSYRVLCQQLGVLCGEDGYTCELNTDEYLLKIRVALKSKKMLQEAEKFVERVAPMNLILDIQLLYNTHRMLHDYGLTNKMLSAFTFGQISTQPFEGGAI